MSRYVTFHVFFPGILRRYLKKNNNNSNGPQLEENRKGKLGISPVCASIHHIVKVCLVKLLPQRGCVYFACLPGIVPGSEMYMYRGSCARCEDVIERRQPGPVALSIEHGQAALSYLLCRPCLNWLVERCGPHLNGRVSSPRHCRRDPEVCVTVQAIPILVRRGKRKRREKKMGSTSAH